MKANKLRLPTNTAECQIIGVNQNSSLIFNIQEGANQIKSFKGKSKLGLAMADAVSEHVKSMPWIPPTD